MKNFLLTLAVKLERLKEDNGQDLIEYALIAALVAFGAAAGMNTVANDLNSAFSQIGTKLVFYTGQ